MYSFVFSAFTLSVDFIFNNIFEQHHRDRFNIVMGLQEDNRGVGYNTNQSRIAFASGGFFGEGFLEGSQTKGSFVPEQHTDYIFSTVGEEWGFLGASLVIFLFSYLLYVSNHNPILPNLCSVYNLTPLIFSPVSDIVGLLYFREMQLLFCFYNILCFYFLFVRTNLNN